MQMKPAKKEWRCTLATYRRDEINRKWMPKVMHDLHGETFKELQEKVWLVAHEYSAPHRVEISAQAYQFQPKGLTGSDLRKAQWMDGKGGNA